MKKTRPAAAAVSAVLTAMCVLPYLYVLVRSFVVAGEGVTLRYFYRAFLSNPAYLLRFWKSLALTLCIALGQLLVSVLAGYGFAKCRFPGRNALFFAMMVLMILPLQVTLVPNYLMLRDLGLLNTYYALALPSVFLPLGTFLMTQSFRSVPNDIVEAARLDGCSTVGIIFRVAAPMNKSGLVCTMLLSFLDGWNMVEQPIVYLGDTADYPLSVALATVLPSSPAVQLVCCILVVLPPMFLFLYYNRELVEGIAIGGEK